MNESVVTAERAQAALADVQGVRNGLADRVVCPRGRHELVGVLAGVYVMLQGGPVWGYLAYAAAMFGVLIAMAVRARRKNGFWVNGYRRGRTRRVVAVFLVAWMAILMATIWGAKEAHLAWAPFVGGVVAAVVVTLAGHAWERAYRAEMVAKG